jgi:hypothetical protein
LRNDTPHMLQDMRGRYSCVSVRVCTCVCMCVCLHARVLKFSLACAYEFFKFELKSSALLFLQLISFVYHTKFHEQLALSLPDNCPLSGSIAAGFRCRTWRFVGIFLIHVLDYPLRSSWSQCRITRRFCAFWCAAQHFWCLPVHVCVS